METTIDNAEQWREASSELYSLIWQSVRDAGAEILEYNPDAVTVSDLDDAITEQADSLIPAYYAEQVREWYALGLPEADYDNGQAGIYAGIQSALFEHYRNELTAVVSELLEKKAGE